MKINANSIRVGNVIEHQGRLWLVAKPPEHTMPGKGGAFIQVELKELTTGTKLNERFRSSEDVEKIHIDEVKYQYLYQDDGFVTLMHPETYEQITVEKELFGDSIAFLQDGMVVTLDLYNEKPLSVRLPATVILTIESADPVVKGQTSTASYKPAILENGVRIMVPPFIESGTKVIIKTDDRTYVERAK